MKETNPKLTLALIAVLIASLLVGAAIAVQTFTQNVTWIWENANPQFTVEGETGTLEFGVVVEGESTRTHTYTVSNTGNVEIHVYAQADCINCAATWSDTSVVIPVGGSASFTLTLEIAGQGSCVVTFHL